MDLWFVSYFISNYFITHKNKISVFFFEILNMISTLSGVIECFLFIVVSSQNFFIRYLQLSDNLCLDFQRFSLLAALPLLPPSHLK